LAESGEKEKERERERERKKERGGGRKGDWKRMHGPRHEPE